ncbi:MAG: hypothetical protein EHM42_04555 [Planctomycetaceae bacterium]|nr:MAG: hypothetical protein EHM42_04555 [Planctomycetaceae bacterium]
MHCHHGKHRGPAAAAACALATEKWSRGQATAWLKQAGTDPAYRGLYRDVNELVIPDEAETSALAPDFPETVPAPSLVEAMLEIDRLHDDLKRLANQNWKPAAGARSAPAEVAVQLLEHYRELQRNEETERRGPGFASRLKQAEDGADALREALEPFETSRASAAELEKVTQAFGRVGQNCKACHTEFRDGSDR